MGKPPQRVAEISEYSTKWVKEILRRYEQRGVRDLGDRCHHNPGGAERALLDAEQREELREALRRPAPDGGLWSSEPKVALCISGKTSGCRVGAQRGWEYLKRLGHTPQVPGPSNPEADPDEQEAFKKSCPSG